MHLVLGSNLRYSSRLAWVISATVSTSSSFDERWVMVSARFLEPRKLPFLVVTLLSMSTQLSSACALAAYTFNEYKTKPSPASVGSFVISIPTELNSSMKSALAQAQKLRPSIYVARNLINTPPNDLAPADLASAAKTAVSSLPVTVKIWDERAPKGERLRARFWGLGSAPLDHPA